MWYYLLLILAAGMALLHILIFERINRLYQLNRFNGEISMRTLPMWFNRKSTSDNTRYLISAFKSIPPRQKPYLIKTHGAILKRIKRYEEQGKVDILRVELMRRPLNLGLYKRRLGSKKSPDEKVPQHCITFRVL